jgi:uncharacterized membrane protein
MTDEHYDGLVTLGRYAQEDETGSIGLEGLLIIGSSGISGSVVGFFGLVVYCVVFFCVWKFYQILSKINDNVAGIRRAVERNAGDRPTNSHSSGLG